MVLNTKVICLQFCNLVRWGGWWGVPGWLLLPLSAAGVLFCPLSPSCGNPSHFPSFSSVTVSLCLSSKALHLWPAASQPIPGALQDEAMTLSCSEANGEEALLPSLPRTGGPHRMATRLPSPEPLCSSGPTSCLGAREPMWRPLTLLLPIWVSSSGVRVWHGLALESWSLIWGFQPPLGIALTSSWGICRSPGCQQGRQLAILVSEPARGWGKRSQVCGEIVCDWHVFIQLSPIGLGTSLYLVIPLPWHRPLLSRQELNIRKYDAAEAEVRINSKSQLELAWS